MKNQMIIISKEELYQVVKDAIRNEVYSIKDVSNKEQQEIEQMFGNSPSHEEINLDDCVEL